MATALRPLSTGELLDRTFSLYRNHFVLFVGIFALPHLCVLAFQCLSFALQTPGSNLRNVLVISVFGLIAVVLSMVVAAAAQAATVVAVSQVHLDRPAGVMDSFSKVQHQIIGVIGLSLKIGIFVGLWSLLFIVPGILKAIEWSLAVPAKVLEDKGASEAMSRSSELSQGNRGRIFVIWFLFMVLSIGVSMLFQWPIQIGARASGGNISPVRNVAVVWQVASLIATFFAQCLVGPLATIAFSLVYYDERVRKEAFDLQLMMTTIDAPALQGARRKVRMTARCTHILAGLLIASCFCLADSGSGNELTVAEYYTELDQLLIAAQQLDSSGRSIPPILKDLPPSWRVRMEQQDFEISAEGLRQDVRKFTQDGDFSAANAIRSRIKRLRDDLDGFETSPQDVSTIREHLTAILARREFRDVRGPTFFDRLAQRLLAIILSLLGLLFRSSAIPTISKVLVYGLIGLAVLMLGYLAYRQIKSSSEQENVVPLEVPVSAKRWELWLADARAAAEQDNWRDAVHLAYWAAISFLEHQGTWRPDRARTPREYLRLMSASSEHRETLAVLTQIFELTWYAKRKTDAGTFAQTMQSLERLGCHPS